MTQYSIQKEKFGELLLTLSEPAEEGKKLKNYISQYGTDILEQLDQTDLSPALTERLKTIRAILSIGANVSSRGWRDNE